MKWREQVVTDAGAKYKDHYSEDGHWWCAEGLDERARKAGKPWLLMHCRDPTKPRWERVDTFKKIAEAKRFAEECSP